LQFVKSRADIECEQSQPNNKILSSSYLPLTILDPLHLAFKLRIYEFGIDKNIIFPEPTG
jgi:hypothetical protein